MKFEGIEAVEAAVGRVDDLVPPAEQLGNAVLPDNRRIIRLAGPVFATFSLLLVPWIVFVAAQLPARKLSANYDIAWAGFDVFLFAGLAATAVCAFRRSRWLPLAASAAGTLLVVDAWFDVVTSQGGRDLILAIASAALVELPLSALCWFLAQQAEDFVEERIKAVLPRGRISRRRKAQSTAGSDAT
jgi:hypothetical protein